MDNISNYYPLILVNLSFCHILYILVRFIDILKLQMWTSNLRELIVVTSLHCASRWALMWNTAYKYCPSQQKAKQFHFIQFRVQPQNADLFVRADWIHSLWMFVRERNINSKINGVITSLFMALCTNQSNQKFSFQKPGCSQCEDSDQFREIPLCICI